MKNPIQILNDHNVLTVLIVILCFYSVMAGLMETRKEIHNYGISTESLLGENGAQLFKKKLPKNSVVAYVTDNKYDLKSLAVLQYELSPRILLQGKPQQRIIMSINGPSSYEQFFKRYPAPKYIIGNFDTKFKYDEFFTANSVELIAEINNFMLFKRK